MLSDTNYAAAELLNRMAATNEAFISLAQYFRGQREISEVCRGFDIRSYVTGPTLELYLDVETHAGKAFSWWLEVRWSETEWTIESSVRTNDEKGQDIIKEFPERSCNALSDFLDALEQATGDLMDSARTFDFSGFS